MHWRFLLLVFIFVCQVGYGFPRGTHEVSIPKVAGVRTNLLANIAPIIEKSIAADHYPGLIILASHNGQIIYKGIFGSRRIEPDIAPMHFDTIFDLASLTKVVATTPAIMQLVEKGALSLDAPVKRYWPEFESHGKDKITIRELLTHTSGLPAEVAETNSNVLEQIKKLKLSHEPGTTFLYSDVNFIVLAHIVELISHEHFDNYVREHIFKPLQMNTTFFVPEKKWHDLIAPTEIINKKLRWGEVQDPIAHAMGGISGNAGLFSTISDLGKYAQSLLDGGANASHSGYILGPLTILKMTTQQTPNNISDTRGLGWDIDSIYSNRGVLFPINSYGHTGWTGTSIWIDPATKTWIIILTNRLHPRSHGNQLVEERRTISNIISASITDISTQTENNTGKGELTRAYASR